MKNGNGRLAQGESEIRMIWKDYFEALYNMNAQELIVVYSCDFDDAQRGNNFVGEPIKIPETEVRERKIKNER